MLPKEIVTVEGITEYQFANGLRVLLFPDQSKPRMTVNLTVFVGSRHEGYGEAGMAHLLEHLVFKGAPLHPHISQALQGGSARDSPTASAPVSPPPCLTRGPASPSGRSAIR